MVSEEGSPIIWISNGYHMDQKKSSIQCFPFYAMQAIEYPTVDNLSLDVEGAEIPILKAIPFYKVRINLIGIEYRLFHDNVPGKPKWVLD